MSSSDWGQIASALFLLVPVPHEIYLKKAGTVVMLLL